MVKETDLDDIVAAIRVVASGEALLAPTVTRRLIEQVVGEPGRSAPRSRLPITDRDKEVPTLIGPGAANAEIAERLSIRNPTVKTYVGRLLTELGARGRVHLVIIADESGLVGAPGELTPRRRGGRRRPAPRRIPPP